LGRSRRSEATTGSPSADTTSAWATPGVRLAKLSTSQLKSLAWLLSWRMAVLTLWRPGHSRAAQDGRRPTGLDPGRRPGGRTTATLVAGSILQTSRREPAEFLAKSADWMSHFPEGWGRNLDRLRIRVGSGGNLKAVRVGGWLGQAGHSPGHSTCRNAAGQNGTQQTRPPTRPAGIGQECMGQTDVDRLIIARSQVRGLPAPPVSPGQRPGLIALLAPSSFSSFSCCQPT
jgi:hypothetical protein